MILEVVSYYVCNRLFVYQAAITLTTYTIIRTALFIRTRRKRHRLFAFYGIPGPEPRLLDGNLHLYIGQQAGYKVDQKLKEQYGKCFGFYIGDEPIVALSDLNLIKSVFLDNMPSFKSRAAFFIDTMITKSILYADHARWKFMRKIMSPTFSSCSMRGLSSNQFIENSVQLMIAYVENKLDDQTGSASIDIQNLLQATALHLISNMAINLPNVQVREGDPYVESLNSFLSRVDKGLLVYAIRFPFLKRFISFFAAHFEHNATMKLIRQGVNWRIDKSFERSPPTAGGDDKPGQLLDTLIELHRQGRITRDEVMGNAEAILVAGYDTTSTTLAYIFWILGKRPEVQERLRSELVLRGIDSEYLQQVINETMRLYPTVISFTERVATETVHICALTVPQGTRVVYNSWLVHRDPDYWPEPEKFDPERFREGLETHSCAFAPFGLGERKCLGYQLAKLEIETVVCDILLRYRLRTEAPQELELISYAGPLSKPSEKIMIQLERLVLSE